MKYAVKYDRTRTTSAGTLRTYIAHITIVKVPWWKRLLRTRP
jgi:hypothetical protein